VTALALEGAGHVLATNPMPDILLLKLGGSLITDKTRPETPRLDVIVRLAGEIARATQGSPFHLVVGHGSGSFGHVAAKQSGIATGLRSADQLPGVSRTQERAAALHRLVVAALLEAGALPYSIAPSSCLVSDAGRPAAFAAEPLLLALDRGLLPVLYGDVVTDRSWGVSICSTERLFETLAGTLQAKGRTIRRALWLGETDGLYDAAGRTVPDVSAADFDRSTIGSPAGTDVTGGMIHRVETALGLARLGIPSLLANGLVPGLLEKALRGEAVPGTEVL
jgi:isopentenyl phosphate kinase